MGYLTQKSFARSHLAPIAQILSISGLHLSGWEGARVLHFSVVYWRYSVLARSPQDRILWANTMRPGSVSACACWEKVRETSIKASRTAARIAVLRVLHNCFATTCTTFKA